MPDQNRSYIITIDGPAGAGKSTVAKKLALRLGFRYINTGDLYRYVTFRALQKKLDVRNSSDMDTLSLKIVNQWIERKKSGDQADIFSDQQNIILEKIHSPEVDKNVSFVAQHPSVRRNLVSLQRMLTKDGSVVVEGRDIGSVILPYADLKIFLTADEQTRIKRRYKELKEKGYIITFQEVQAEIALRDDIDSRRETAPLTRPKNSITIDTSNKEIDEVIKLVLGIIQSRKGTKHL